MCEPCLDSGLKKPTVNRHFSAESSEINAGERGSPTAPWVSPTPWRLLFWNCTFSHPQLKRQGPLSRNWAIPRHPAPRRKGRLPGKKIQKPCLVEQEAVLGASRGNVQVPLEQFLPRGFWQPRVSLKSIHVQKHKTTALSKVPRKWERRKRDGQQSSGTLGFAYFSGAPPEHLHFLGHMGFV